MTLIKSVFLICILLFLLVTSVVNAKTGVEWNDDGVALHDLGRYEEAIACYDKALEIDPHAADVWYNKGLSLGYLGRYEEEIACYDKALGIDPHDADARYNNGLAEISLVSGFEAMFAITGLLAVAYLIRRKYILR